MTSEKKIGFGIITGLVFGIIIGLSLNNLPLWIGVGIALGAGIGSTFKLKNTLN